MPVLGKPANAGAVGFNAKADVTAEMGPVFGTDVEQEPFFNVRGTSTAKLLARRGGLPSGNRGNPFANERSGNDACGNPFDK